MQAELHPVWWEWGAAKAGFAVEKLIDKTVPIKLCKFAYCVWTLIDSSLHMYLNNISKLKLSSTPRMYLELVNHLLPVSSFPFSSVKMLGCIQIVSLTWKGKSLNHPETLREKIISVGCVWAVIAQADKSDVVEEWERIVRNSFRLLLPDILDYMLLSSFWNSHCHHMHFCWNILFKCF